MEPSKNSSAPKAGVRYTLAEWRFWPEGERWELINGFAYDMSPSSRVRHQYHVGDLFAELRTFLKGKKRAPFIAPLDVYLDNNASGDSEDNGSTVVESDVLVVCDQEKIGEDGIHGASDFVAEVLSDSTANKDFGIKKELYERAGVREYWIIQTDTSTVFQYVREAAPEAEPSTALAPVKSSIFPGFQWACG